MPRRKKRSGSEFEFDHAFQAEVLWCCLRTGSFLRETRGALSADSFSDPVHQVIADVVLTHYDEFGVPPSLGAIQENLRVGLAGSTGVTLRDARKSLADLLASQNVSVEFIGKRVRDFSAQSAARALVAEMDTYFTEGRYEEWTEAIGKALLVRHAEPAGVNFTVGLEERLRSYKKGFRKLNPVSTGVHKLDGYLAGGLDRGELGVVMAIRGTGKTHCLVHLGAAAVEAKLSVWHVSLEMGLRQILRRYDKRLGRATDIDLSRKCHKIAKALDGRELRLFQYPSSRMTCATLRSMLYRLGSPDLLIVDYGKLLAPDTRRSAKYEEIGECYAGLRDLGGEFGMAVWSAAQIVRAGHEMAKSEGDFLMGHHLAESILIADHADVLISFNQTLQEKEENRARLWVDKARESIDKKEVPVIADWDLSLVT